MPSSFVTALSISVSVGVCVWTRARVCVRGGFQCNVTVLPLHPPRFYQRSGPFKRRRVSLCLWLSSCMSFNFIKLENRKYELTPYTSEQWEGGGGGEGGEGPSRSAWRRR